MVSRNNKIGLEIPGEAESNLEFSQIDDYLPLMDSHTISEILSEACTKLTIDTVAKILEKFQVTTEDVIRYELFEKACSKGNLEVAKFLVSFYGIKSKHIFNITRQKKSCYYVADIIYEGHFKVIKWLTEEYNILAGFVEETYEDLFNRCCKNGSLKMVKWYAKTFNITQEKFYKNDQLGPFFNACFGGKKLTAQWLVKKFKIDRSKAYSTASSNRRPYLLSICESEEDRFEFIMWYVNKFNLTRKDIWKDDVVLSIITCCDYGHLESAM